MWNPPRIGLIDTIDGGTRWIPLFAPTSIIRYDHMALNLALLYWGVGPDALKIGKDAIDVLAPNGTKITTIPLVDGQLLEVNWFSAWQSNLNPRIGFSDVYNYARMLAEPDEALRKKGQEFFAQFQGAVVLIGPVDTATPVKKPTPAPAPAKCPSPSFQFRAIIQRRTGIMHIKNTPITVSITPGGRVSKVRAPSAAAGMPVAL